MSLVLWIANFVCSIDGLLAYMDDNFSFDTCDSLVLYPAYDTLLPCKQVKLLSLWDDIGLPYDKDKQEFGRTLVITGLLVDRQAMTVTLDPSPKQELISAIRSFLDSSDPSCGRKRKLRDWLHLLGWMSLALNVCLLLRPPLTSAYHKVAGKNVLNAPLFLNAEVKQDFTWFADIFESFDGIHILRSLT
jgi:hypothetical protein